MTLVSKSRSLSPFDDSIRNWRPSTLACGSSFPLPSLLPPFSGRSYAFDWTSFSILVKAVQRAHQKEKELTANDATLYNASLPYPSAWLSLRAIEGHPIEIHVLVVTMFRWKVMTTSLWIKRPSRHLKIFSWRDNKCCIRNALRKVVYYHSSTQSPSIDCFFSCSVHSWI